MSRTEKGRAIFYTRDSGGKHETTPTQYVAWAKSKAAELSVRFDGTEDAIVAMIKNGECHRGGRTRRHTARQAAVARPGEEPAGRSGFRHELLVANVSPAV